MKRMSNWSTNLLWIMALWDFAWKGHILRWSDQANR